LTLQAPVGTIACVKGMQMTIRRIPERVRRKQRELARSEAKSLNRVALEVVRILRQTTRVAHA
jgi:hypothetical protein